MPVLITGGHGFIGQAVAAKLLAVGADVVLTRFRSTQLAPGLESYSESRLRSVALDVTETRGILDTLTSHGIGEVIHLASGGWGKSLAEDFHTNVVGYLNLLEACHLARVRRVIAASSIAVYGDAIGPYDERHPLTIDPPNNGPGYFKRVEESLGAYLRKTAGLDVVSTRIAMIFGPGYRRMTSLISRICVAIARGHDIEIPHTKYPYSDCCHVEDTAEGIVKMVFANRLPEPVYNLGQGCGFSKDDLLAASETLGMKKSSLKMLRDTEQWWGAGNYMAIDAARRDFGYSPSYSLLTGLDNYIRALRRQQ